MPAPSLSIQECRSCAWLWRLSSQQVMNDCLQVVRKHFYNWTPFRDFQTFPVAWLASFCGNSSASTQIRKLNEGVVLNNSGLLLVKYFMLRWKCYHQARHQWLTPVILATQEAEIRRISVWSQLRQIVLETYFEKTLHKKGPTEWLKVKALSSNPSTARKRKKYKI
jgi:hypothetical protein